MKSVRLFKAIIYLTDQSNGSATLMRGKSATCRLRTFFLLRVSGRTVKDR